MKLLLTLGIFLLFTSAHAQKKPFRFAFISDTHIGSPNGSAEEDLRRTVADINSQKGIAFVVLTGDITELGTNKELQLAKELLDSLNIKYYIIPGNHDTGWSESGGLAFSKIFGDDKFHFVYEGVHFIGCASGPYVRMSDGHVPRHHMNWLKTQLKKIRKDEPVVFLNHYPLDAGLDNWYEVIHLLKQKNTVLALCGHGHNNRPVQAEGIPAVMGRSNLRAKAAGGGYNLVDFRMDSILFTERQPLSKKEKTWTGVLQQKQRYTNEGYARPDFSINNKYPDVKVAWTYQSAANVISTPAVINGQVIFGNQNGVIEALSLTNGKRVWQQKTGGPIFSSPAVTNNQIILGSADHFVYNINTKGKITWRSKTEGPVLGSPAIANGLAYIGSSDGKFRAYDIATGKPIWAYSGIGGPITSKPVIVNDKIIFGAWDRNLYALDKRTGTLLWKWNNGSSVINYSPAACIPVVHDGVVYVVAPDRYLTAIDLENGKTLWRTNEATVRESIGISEDGKMVYGKTMQDTIVAFYTNREAPKLAWKASMGFGYEHVPSMLIEKEGKVFFGTKNGVVYCINPTTQKINWAYKIDNSMVNTINVIDSHQVIASTMDGKVVLIREK